MVAGLTTIIESDLDNPELASAQGFLSQVQANASLWEADFVNAVRHHAVAVYSQPLGGAQPVWDECERNYGLGRGSYREEVAQTLRQWFEDNVDLREELDRRVTHAWEDELPYR